MQRLVSSSKYLLLTLLVSILIMQSYQLSLVHDISAVSSSPSFVRQEIFDAPNDWQLWKGYSNVSTITTRDGHSIQIDSANNITQCKISDKFISPDMESVSYISNGKTLNGTVWLTSDFEEPPFKDNIDIYREQFEIKVSNLKASSHMTLEKYAAIKIAELYNPLNNVTIDENSNSTTIAGNPAYKVVYSARNGEGIDLKNMTHWTIKDGKAYDITYSALRVNYSDYLPTIQKMINSFEFEGSYAGSKPGKQQVHNSDVSEFEGLGIKINYPVDWKKKDGTTDGGSSRIVLFRSPFEDKGLDRPSWHDTSFTMAIAIDSVQHAGVTDYRVILSRNQINNNNNNNSSNTNHNSTWSWTRQVTEVSAYDKSRVLEEEKNYKGFYGKDKPYILFSFDLEKVNFPQQYRAVFYITDYFVKEHRFCRLIDTTTWVIIPPPEFIMSIITPGSIVLRPGEEKDIELTIKGNTHLPSEAFLTDSNNDNYDKAISLSFITNKVSIPPSMVGTSTLHVKALANPKAAVSYTLPLIANIFFPTKITNRGGETFSNSKNLSLTQTSNLTLTVLPPYTIEEHLSSFVNTWITPVTGVWTFLVGVGAVIAPLVINIYRKKQKNNNYKRRIDEY